MPDFLVLKLNVNAPPATPGAERLQPALGGSAQDWQPVLIALGVDDEEAATKQAYSGEGTYKVLPWDDDAEVAVTPGEPEVAMVSRKAIAEERAAEEAATAKGA